MTFKLFKKYLKENPEFEREHPRVPRGSSEGGEFTTKRKRMTVDDLEKAKELYASHRGSPEIGAILGFDSKTILSALRRMGIEIRNMSNAKRKYTLNQKSFNKITPQAAYWAGMLMADGCISSGGKRHPEVNIISIELQKRDKQHIQKFLNFIKSNAVIRDRVRKDPIMGIKAKAPREESSVSIVSQEMSDDLRKLGIVQDKTFRANADLLKDNLHFWRGLVDGDGSFNDYSEGVIFRAIGSKPLMEDFLKFIKTFITTSASVVECTKIHRHIFIR